MTSIRVGMPRSTSKWVCSRQADLLWPWTFFKYAASAIVESVWTTLPSTAERS